MYLHYYQRYFQEKMERKLFNLEKLSNRPASLGRYEEGGILLDLKASTLISAIIELTGEVDMERKSFFFKYDNIRNPINGVIYIKAFS